MKKVKNKSKGHKSNKNVSMKKTKIQYSAGLNNSLRVLNYLKKYKNIGEIYVNTLQNGRETGLTFIVERKNNNVEQKDFFTFCVYEHRNSDEIIINGKEGFLSYELPYISKTGLNLLVSLAVLTLS